MMFQDPQSGRFDDGIPERQPTIRDHIQAKRDKDVRFHVNQVTRPARGRSAVKQRSTAVAAAKAKARAVKQRSLSGRPAAGSGA